MVTLHHENENNFFTNDSGHLLNAICIASTETE